MLRVFAVKNRNMLSTKRNPGRYRGCNNKLREMYNMKILTNTTAIVLAVASTSVFAHHPSEGVSPSFDMVDAQLEAVESPHLDMDMDAMGASTAAVDTEMATATQGQNGWVANQTGVDITEVESPMDEAAAAGTISLMEQ